MYSMIDLCLLCVTNSKDMKSLSSADTDGIIIEEKCNSFLYEFVDIKPAISNRICSFCLDNLNYAYYFKQMCLQNIGRLNKYVDMIRHLGSYKELSVSLTDTTIEPVEIKRRVTFAENLEEFMSEDEPDWECLSTNDDSGSDCETKPRTGRKRRRRRKKNKKQEPVLERGSFKCDACDIIYTVKSLYLRHLMVKHRMYYCATSEDSENEANNSTDLNSTPPSAANPLSPSPKRERKWICTVCNKAFLNSNNLARHRRVHTGERPFRCSHCQKTFVELGHLNSHIRTHTGERPYACDICPKKFTQTANLIAHKRIHANLRPYQCTQCKWSFKQSGDLKGHMLIHTGEKPFRCRICHYRCTRAETLRKHLRMHARNSR